MRYCLAHWLSAVLLATACLATPTVELVGEAAATDHDRLIELLDAAERNGIVSIEGRANRARAELAGADARPRARTPTRGGLTPAARRVAELSASGTTNRDVAAKLFISLNTVEATLARVYRKLGIRSRAELALHMNTTRR
jgi:DNA-binding CsgD family transcriptional regulator